MTADVGRTKEAVTSFADGFDTLTHEQWRDLAAKALNRGRPEERHLVGPAAEAALRMATVDGLVIEPLYEAPDRQRPLGYPGLMPFTRGVAIRHQQVPWDVRALHADPDPKAGRQAVLLDLERGVTSIWLHVGEGALAPGDLDEVLADLLLDLAPVAVTGRDDDETAAAALQAVWARRGAADEAVLGNLGHDPLGRWARTGRADREDDPFAALVAAGRRCLGRHPGVQAGVVDALTYHNAGAGEVEEVGCAIATGIAYLRAFEAAGIGPADAARQLEFRISATADQFLTIAKLRALRRLWARVGEACGVPESGRGARTHAVMSWRMATRDDPWVNMLRGTVACFGAAAGGADAVTVLPFDALWGQPDVLARRIARNTQILVAEEASIGRVTDPGGGSWYVEHLTDDLATKAWSWVQAIEADGGMATALSSGLVADRIEAVSEQRSARLADRSQPITGVSAFPHPSEVPLERRPAPPLWAEGNDLAESRPALPVRRDAARFEALRDRSADHARTCGQAPHVVLVCLGTRRDFGSREMFAANLVGVAGVLTRRVEAPTAGALRAALASGGGETGPGSPASVALLCSSARVYADQGSAAIEAVRDAGMGRVYLTGRHHELPGDPPGADRYLYEGIDVVETLGGILDDLGVAR